MGLRLKKITQTMENCKMKEYKFPRCADLYDYSPERSYSSLQGDVYDLSSQKKPTHRRVLSQTMLQRGKSKENKLSSLSPLKLESCIKMNSKLSPPKFFLLSQVRKQNQQSKSTKIQYSQLGRSKKVPRMHTETIENITKYRLG